MLVARPGGTHGPGPNRHGDAAEFELEMPGPSSTRRFIFCGEHSQVGADKNGNQRRARGRAPSRMWRARAGGRGEPGGGWSLIAIVARCRWMGCLIGMFCFDAELSRRASGRVARSAASRSMISASKISNIVERLRLRLPGTGWFTRFSIQ
jgi:hypothetical protein